MTANLPNKVTPNPTEPPCELCQDVEARLMAGYGMASVACKFHKGDAHKACLALIVPLEKGDDTVDPVDVVKDIMLLGDQGRSIDETAMLFTSIIEEAATKAAKEAND